MSEDVRKFLEDLYRDTATLSIEGEKLNAELVFKKGKLTAFMISYEGDRVFKIYGGEDVVKINMYYLSKKKRMFMTVGKRDLLKEFNEKYRKEKGISENEAKEYFESLLDYINALADNRVSDVVSEIKKAVEKGVQVK